MTWFTLIKRSLLHYRRIHVGVAASVAFATAVLVGALLVGDSVRYTLAQLVEARLGRTQLALPAGDRFFGADLAGRLTERIDVPVAAVLQVGGLAVNPDTDRRANQVQILGVGAGFWALAPAADGGRQSGSELTEGPVALIRRSLAQHLGIETGSQIILRVAKPGVVPRDVPVTGDDQASIALRVTVAGILDEMQFGRFSLQADQVAPLNVFVPIGFLSDRLDVSRLAASSAKAHDATESESSTRAAANLLLVAGDVSLERAQQALDTVAQLDDLGLELRVLGDSGMIEMRSRRVFIDDALGQAAMREPEATGVLTYFVNELRCGENATPYSMVTALTPGGLYDEVLPEQFPDDRIVINTWLAEDLDAAAGDAITLRYFVVGPDRRLLEETRTFTVDKVVPIAGLAADGELMPAFPGLVDTDNCRDWKPGIDIDYDKIRTKDEDYWDTYRGTPKAFVGLAAGRAMWENRFGTLTAVRYPAAAHSVESLGATLIERIDPAEAGLRFVPIRRLHEQAGKGSSDFGSLFLGLSMFLIASAVVLLILVFVFGVERRIPQLGMLLAVGFSRRQVRGLFLGEGLALALVGAVAGVIGGLIYTRLTIWALATVWAGAVAGSPIRFHAAAGSLVGGAAAGVAISLAAIIWAVWRAMGRHAAELMAGGVQVESPAVVARRGRWSLIVAAITLVAAILLLVTVGGSSSAAAGAFFGAGALLLVAAIAFSTWWLAAGQGAGTGGLNTLGQLARRNRARRRGRSLAVVILLACGVFMVVAVGANRKDPAARLEQPDGPAGGFTQYGESAIGIVRDLGAAAGRDKLGLSEDAFADVRIVPMRLRAGDDASCLNLNHAQQPRLLGVDPEQLSGRFAFRSVETPPALGGAKGDEEAPPSGWAILRADWGEDVVPAIGDYPTVYWALHKRLGDEIDYVDDRGRTFRVRIVGMLEGSVLQGALLIDEGAFIARFGSVAGRQVFLVDAPSSRAEAVAEALRRGLRDYGLDLTPTAERLARFHTVENTYLSIFQLLGGMGLAVGSVGLALVVLVNILERRSELAMLQAVGFDQRTVGRMLAVEHIGLLGAGLLWGLVSAIVAVWPAVRTAGSRIPIGSLAVILAAIGASGLVWILIATRLGLRGRLLDALRSE